MEVGVDDQRREPRRLELTTKGEPRSLGLETKGESQGGWTWGPRERARKVGPGDQGREPGS